MDTMALEISVYDSEEFEQMISNKDIRIAKALVETILKNLEGKKKYFHAMSVLVEKDQTIYDITVDKRDFLHTLESNLPIYEKHELYEDCAEILKAINKLKGASKKRGRPKKNLDS